MTRTIAIAALAATAASLAGTTGPDVILSDSTSTTNYGNIGGIRAYAIGSNTCNIGDQNLIWASSGTPGLAMNLYRLHDGRLEQLGLSFAKTACCAFAANGCGLGCNGQGGNVLGAGCLDVYSATFNGGQSRLAPRSRINPFSGAFQPIPSGSGDAIWRRLQVPQADLMESSFPGAFYFIEGVYVGTDDAQNGNWLNNASYRRVNVSQSNFNLTVTDSIHPTIPGIYAWRQYGNGINQSDDSIEIVPVTVPDEGTFHIGGTARDLGRGMWRYEYAAYNLNSHRSGGSFTVPLPPGSRPVNVGFHAPPYHSGEPYDNSSWEVEITSNAITWRSPETFEQNENSNALRWGTMYNFWFDLAAEPDDGEVTLGLFMPAPGGPDFIDAPLPVPGGCPADLNGSGGVDAEDLAMLLGAWGTPNADLNGDGTTDPFDLALILGGWGECG